MPDLIRDASWEDIAPVLRDPTLTIGLAGPPGVGKTEGLYRAGLAMKKPYIGKIQFHSEMSPAEMLGYTLPHDAGYVWEPGPVDHAYSRGGLLILDEIAEASGPCKTYLYGVLDRGLGGHIDYVGRKFVPKKGYQPVATMNEAPDSGVLPLPLLDRFDAWFLILKPSQAMLEMLDPDLAEFCFNMYEAAEDPFAGPDLTYRFFQSFQKLRKIQPLDMAALGAARSDKKLAGSFLEGLALYAEVDPDDVDYDDDAEDEEDEDLNADIEDELDLDDGDD